MDKRKHTDSEEYINHLEEWMDHQYDTGYYTGGKIHPLFKYMRRPSRKVALWLGIVIAIFAIWRFFIDFDSNVSMCLMDILVFFIGGTIFVSNFADLRSGRRNK